MRRLFVTMAVVAAVLVLAVPTAQAVIPVQPTAQALEVMTCQTISGNEPCTVNLSDGTENVATVIAAQTGTTLTVTFTAIAPWTLTTAGASVSATPPGDTDSLTACLVADDKTSATCTFTPPAGDCLYFKAGAAVVQSLSQPNLENFAKGLPAQVTMSVTYPSAGAPSYFGTTITNGEILNGPHEGWCVDTDHTINQNTNYTASVYSSFETLPAGIVGHPENFDLVNWILNQEYVGKTAACGGTFTYGDVQRAIWQLIATQQSTSGLGTWTQCHVDEIVAAAYASGESFTPDCGDVIAVVLVPVGSPQPQVIIAQVTVVTVPTTCEVTKNIAAVCFQCCLKGSLEVTKVVNILRHVPATTTFDICIQGPSYPEPNCKTFEAGQTLEWTGLLRGDYTITESIAEAGWTIVVDASPVTVIGGQTVSATVTNNFSYCTLTPGYWKTHSIQGPAPYDDTWARVLGGLEERTPFFNSGQTYYEVLWTEPKGGNAYYILAHAYIAAYLNTLGGLTPISEVSDAMAWAGEFFGEYLPTDRLSKDVRAQAIAKATILDNFNNGLIGPGHCD